MWQPDVQPEFSFERRARKYGVQAARDHWALLNLERNKRLMEADAIEQAMAKDRERKGGTYVVNDELGFKRAQMHAYSYFELVRSSLNEKGARGGEFLDDEEYMKWFVKKNPACDPGKPTTGKISSGWNPQIDAAFRAGLQERQAQQQLRGGLVS